MSNQTIRIHFINNKKNLDFCEDMKIIKFSYVQKFNTNKTSLIS